MARQPFESEYIYGLHEPGGEGLMAERNTKGWILFTEAIGHDPNDRNGGNYTKWSSQGWHIMSRLNNGYQPAGTIPESGQYANFARRCANFVAATPGCHIWIIGNEMNYWVERPGAYTRGVLPATRGQSEEEIYNILRGMPDRFNALHPDEPSSRGAASGEVITPELYARCYKLCRNAIKSVPGHENDIVVIGSVAPWNNQTTYPGNPNGDWVQYFEDILKQLGPDNCDGITIHTYTHAADPNQIHDDVKMGPPFQNRHYNFRTYQDFMNAVPQNMRHLPCYITEADEDVAWDNRNIGWVQRAYGEIDHWNKQPGNQQIRALILYRWPNVPGDRWQIDGKGGVHDDFRDAVKMGYKWNPNAVAASASSKVQPAQVVAAAPLNKGGQATMATIVNLRKSAGYMGKPDSDKIGEIPEGASATIMAGPINKDGLTWWQVRTQDATGRPVTGWAAQVDPLGNTLLAGVAGAAPATSAPPSTPSAPLTPSDIKLGMHVTTGDIVNLRQSPGYVGKPASDVVAEVPFQTRSVVLAGPQTVDGLIWYRVSCVLDNGSKATGWMAAFSPTGDPLLVADSSTAQASPGKVTPPASPTSTPTSTPMSTPAPAIQGKFRKGQPIYMANYVNMRRSPGYVGKMPDDVVIDIVINTSGTILDGPRQADGLTWWEVRSTGSNRATVSGWVAEVDPNGLDLIAAGTPPSSAPPAPTPVPSTAQIKTYSRGDMVVNITNDLVNLRSTPGFVGKPARDVVASAPSRTALMVLEGPRDADGLVWWKVSGTVPGTGKVEGWLAEAAPGGVRLMAPAQFSRIIVVSKPFIGNFALSQNWGSNPQFYARFTYDGVALKGHNGLDFGTPTGTPLVAADSGDVLKVDFEPGGFGHHVLIRHRWGESLYAHMNRVTVSVGQNLNRGDRIGESGNTGAGTGPHLHFGIRVNPYRRPDGWGGFTDPIPFMDPNDIIHSRDVEKPVPMAPEVPGRSRP